MTNTLTKVTATAVGIDFDIFSTAAGSPVSTGTLVQVGYSISEYQGGVFLGENTGSLNVGDPPIGISYTSGLASYLVRLTFVYDDGAYTVHVTPYERSAGGIYSLSYDTPTLSLNCRSAILEVQNLSVDAGRTSNEAWLDSSFVTIDTGNTFVGDIPENPPLGFPNLVYSIGLDVTEWTDFDPTMDAYEIGAVGWVTPDCT